MEQKKLKIRLTKHAEEKIQVRKISVKEIREIVLDPDWQEIDKFDNDLIHFIGKIRNKFLRVIGRFENDETFVVVSAFFDRRIKRKDKK